MKRESVTMSVTVLIVAAVICWIVFAAVVATLTTAGGTKMKRSIRDVPDSEDGKE